MTGLQDSPRVETRFMGTAPLVSQLPGGVNEIPYLHNVVSTLVFGKHNPEDGAPVPLSGTLRFRHYAPNFIDGSHEASVLDPRQMGTLMLKHYNDQEGDKSENRKSIVANVALGTACELLASPDRLHELAEYDGGTELIDLIKKCYGGDESIMPLTVVEAWRRHLKVEDGAMGVGPARITFDQHTTWLPVVKRRPGDILVACRAFILPQNILEVKRPDVLDPASSECKELLASLFGATADYIPQGRMKRMIGRKVAATKGTPLLLNKEWQQYTEDSSRPNEVVRSINERELKLDTTTDPRDAIKAIPVRPTDGVWVDPGFPRQISFRFHTYECGDGPIVIAEKRNHGTGGELLGLGFQYKQTVSGGSSDAVLVRSEVMTSSLDKLWEKIGKVPQRLVGMSQLADRNRIHRRVVCEKTGNVFLVLADYCTTELNDRPPLAQVEIEFRGRYGFIDSADHLDEEEIAADFELVRKVVLEGLHTGNVKVTTGQTTKQAWLTA